MNPLDSKVASDLISAAAQQRGYEAAVMLAIMLMSFVGIAWLFKWWVTKSAEREDRALQEAIERETRLSERVTRLEDRITTEVLEITQKATRAMEMVTATMDKLIEDMRSHRVCFWSIEKQSQVLEAAGKVAADRVIEIISERVKGMKEIGK